MIKIITNTLMSFILASSTIAYAEESDGWKHRLSVYGWLPSFNGTLKYTIPGKPGEPGEPGVPDEEGESDVLDKLDMIFMGSYEIKKNKWSFLADMIYLKMSDEQKKSVSILPGIGGPKITVGSEQELTAWLLGFYGGYNIVDTENTTFDLIAGMRYFSLGLDATFTIADRHPSISPSIEAYDAVIGVKGKVDINTNWYMPYLFDIGAGDSDLTWQAEASIGYRFDWGDALLTYRYIHYDKGDLGLIDDFDFYGPKLGLVFHF